MQLDATGNSVLSQTHYLTNQYGRLRDICVGAQKEIYLATNGSSWSNTNPNTHSIIVLRPPNDLGIDEVDGSKIAVFPNPISTSFTVQFSGNTVGNQISLTDMTGRMIYSAWIDTPSTVIDTAHLNKGVYVLTIHSKNGKNYTKKLIK
jgi:hypothetical protein